MNTQYGYVDPSNAEWDDEEARLLARIATLEEAVRIGRTFAADVANTPTSVIPPAYISGARHVHKALDAVLSTLPPQANAAETNA